MAIKQTYMNYMKKAFIARSMLVMVIIFCLYIVTSFISYHHIVVKKTNKANKVLNEIVIDDLTAYEKGLKELVSKETIIQAIHDPITTFQANELLYAFRQKLKLKGNFALVDRQGKIISTNLYTPNATHLETSHFIGRSMVLLDKVDSVHQRIDGLKLEKGQESRYFFGNSVKDGEKVVGYLFYFVEDDHQAISSKTDFTLLTDRFDNVIFTSSPILTTSMGKSLTEIQSGLKIIQIEDERYYMRTTLIDEEFKTYNLTSIRIFKQFVLIGIASFTAISVTLGLLMYIMSPAAMKESEKSFIDLLHFINKPELGRSQHMFEEFQQIEKEFEKKMAQINDLMQRNKEIEKTKSKLEIKQLENQFNPHFAFNVLEMLRYEISFDPKNAQEMIVSFANLMRYSTYYGNTTIPLSTDLKYVSDYLKLQKMRFQDRLEYEIYVENGMEEVEIPKLILQPIIENSIKHNIEQVDQLIIAISVRKINEDIQITVQDNGNGIEKEKLKLLKEMLNAGEIHTERKFEHYGLFHCQRIVELLYGEQYKMLIESEQGAGTLVSVRVPIRKGDRHV